jgi:hypothetical protein
VVGPASLELQTSLVHLAASECLLCIDANIHEYHEVRGALKRANVKITDVPKGMCAAARLN